MSTFIMHTFAKTTLHSCTCEATKYFAHRIFFFLLPWVESKPKVSASVWTECSFHETLKRNTVASGQTRIKRSSIIEAAVRVSSRIANVPSGRAKTNKRYSIIYNLFNWTFFLFSFPTVTTSVKAQSKRPQTQRGSVIYKLPAAYIYQSEDFALRTTGLTSTHPKIDYNSKQKANGSGEFISRM